MMGEFLFFMLVQLSIFALGAMVVTSLILLVKRPSYWWAYLGAQVCMTIIIGILLLLVVKTAGGTVNVSLEAYLYIGSVGALGGFVIFICRDLLRRSFEFHEEK